MHEHELLRIRASYEARDVSAEAADTHAWTDSAYRFSMQQIEWHVLSALEELSVPIARARVLEVGCGSGYFAHRFLEYGAATVSGIDLMERRIEAARARYPHLDLVAGDASQLPWSDASFDVVTQFTCLSSILDRGMRARVASEMWRVLAPGGAILSFDMVQPHRVLRWLRTVRGLDGAGSTPTSPVSSDELTRLFPHAGGHVCGMGVGAGALAGRHRVLAQLLASMPLLQTHAVFAGRKPNA